MIIKKIYILYFYSDILPIKFKKIFVVFKRIKIKMTI